MLQLDHGLSPQFPGLTGYTQPAYALVLEMMEGGSLASIIVKQLLAGPSPKYTFSQALSWCLDVARALQYLHAGGRDGFPRIHRDVKLENVLLVEGGKVAKLADFGLQRGIFGQQQHGAPVLVRRSQRPASAVPLSPSGTAEGGGGAVAGGTSLNGAAPGPGQRTTPGPSRMAPADFAERNSQRTASVTAGFGKTSALLSGGGGLESPSSRLGRVGSAASAGSGGGGGGRSTRMSIEADAAAAAAGGGGNFSTGHLAPAPVEPLFFALDDKGLLPLQLPPPSEPPDPYDPHVDSAVRAPMLGPADRVREALDLARRTHSIPQMMQPLGVGELGGLDEGGEALAGVGAAAAAVGAAGGGSRPGSGRTALSRTGEEGEASGGGAGPSRLAAMAGAAAGGGNAAWPVSSGARTAGGGVLSSPRGVSLLAGGAGAAVLTRPSPLGGGSAQASLRAGAKAGPALQAQRSGKSISESMARMNASSLARSPHGAAAATSTAAAAVAVANAAATAAATAAAAGSGSPSPREAGPGPALRPWSVDVGSGAEEAVPVKAMGLVSDPGFSGTVSGLGLGSGLTGGLGAPDGRQSLASCADILLDATSVGGGSALNTAGGGMEGAVLGPSPSGAASLAARAPSSRQTSPTAASAGLGAAGNAAQGAAASDVDPVAVVAAADVAVDDGLTSKGQRQLLPGSMKHVDSGETAHVGLEGLSHSGNANAAAAAAGRPLHDAAAAAAAAAFNRASEDAQARSLESALVSTAAVGFSTAAGMGTDGGTTAAATGTGTGGGNAPGTVSDLSAPASALTTHKSLGDGSGGGGGPGGGGNAGNVAQLLLNGVSAGGGGAGGSTDGQSATSQPVHMADLLHMRLGAVNVSVRSVRAGGGSAVPSLSQRVMGSAPSSPRMAVAAAAAARAGIAPPPAAAGAVRAASVTGTRSRTSSATGLLKNKPQAEFEEVFSLTGRTGSLVYLAPEAYKNEPYNDKVDVYSLAILMYELFGRTSVTYTHISTKLPAFSRMLCNPDEFAERVAAGYRPPRPKAMDKLPPELWELIEAAWHQDPVQRPDIDTVVEALEELAEPLAEAEAGRRNRRSNKQGAEGGAGDAGAASQGCSCTIC
ncbi:hypothetical protein CHLRE_01g012950v5 [Chlamydomonas reinhardtii]|uniref:Protein kinase domain-containing protein n=1 Tax=Chlamydomonas reinhardtii TaxID=3055 RepID=A0A2K3E5K5_CHLRE|nr:uncharacterized protein CHLRE_01g012950v5 [Chlamydomonas reinhardtii]PNW88071.1 hypothetical protein CHLRE_01g012950v5 [Chlamydomonas reinhardtii]